MKFKFLDPVTIINDPFYANVPCIVIEYDKLCALYKVRVQYTTDRWVPEDQLEALPL